MIKYIPCLKCNIRLRPHYLKNGVCNGCQNPHLIVSAGETTLSTNQRGVKCTLQ